MKKRTMAVGGLLLAVAMTGYSVAGTYAKYVSSIDFTDEARVAKWELKGSDKNGNLESSNEIDLFANSYTNNGKEYVRSFECTNPADRSTCDSVVAPGTKGEYSFDLTGTMETMFQLKFDLVNKSDFVVYFTVDAEGNVTNKKVAKELNNGSFTDENGATVNVINADGSLVSGWYEYHPIRYSIDYRTTGDTNPTVQVAKGDINAIAQGLKQYNDNNDSAIANGIEANDGSGRLAHVFYPTDAFKKSFVIAWEWATNNSTITGLDADKVTADLVNELDTYAGENLSAIDDKITFNFKVTAEQVTAKEVGTSVDTTTTNFGTDDEKYSKKN